MGIKNLKALLLQQRSLSPICRRAPCKDLFVDFMGLYISVAYSVTCVQELMSVIQEKVRGWHHIGDRVSLFVDRGHIAIKTPLRMQRRSNMQAQRERKRAAIDSLEAQIRTLDEKDEFYEETRAGLEAQLGKCRFFTYLSEGRNLYCIMDNILDSLPQWVAVIHCDNVDAEFAMCQRAREYARETGEWPALVSHDQDTLCLSCADTLPKVVYSAGTEYILRPCALTVYLVKLTLLLNGGDFFPGLCGIAISPETLPKFKLFPEFNLSNVLRSLVFRSYRIDNCRADADVVALMEFVNKYVTLDASVYDDEPQPKITVHDFIATTLRPYWEAVCGTRVRDDSPLLEKIYCALLPGADDEENSAGTANRAGNIVRAVQMMSRYRVRRPSRDCVEAFVRLLGHTTTARYGVVSVCLKRMEIFLCFEGAFYFNNRFVIENGDNFINISP